MSTEDRDYEFDRIATAYARMVAAADEVIALVRREHPKYGYEVYGTHYEPGTGPAYE
jgi:hypothetical protein